MKRIMLLLILILFCRGAASHAEHLHPDWFGYPPMITIRDIAVYNGYIYCATSGGMFRYDPSTGEYETYFKDHGIIGNDVVCIAATSDALYLGFSEDGLWRFDPETAESELILFPEYHIPSATNPNGIAVNDIVPFSDTVLYVGHANGVDVLDLETEGLRTYTNLGENISENKPVTNVSLVDGKIIACTEMGVAIADIDNPNLEFAENWSSHVYIGNGRTYSMSGVLYIGGDEDTFYTASNRHGIFRINEDDPSLMLVSSTNSQPVTALLEARGEYWVATTEGLYRRNVKLWQLYDGAYSNITTLAADDDGNIWVGTLREGLQCYTEDGYIDVPPVNGLKNLDFYDIAVDSHGVVWSANAYRDQDLMSKFQRLEGDVWTHYPLSAFFNTNKVNSVFVDSDDRVWTAIWGSSTSGVFIIDDDGTPAIDADTVSPVDPSKSILRPTIANSYVVCADITSDHHGNVWIANFQSDPPDHRLEAIPLSGAVVIDGYPINRYQQYSPADDVPLPTGQIYVIRTDEDGWVWLGTHDTGVTALYVGQDPYDTSDTEVRKLTLANGILDSRIKTIEVDHDGFVWVGSRSGLNRIEKKAGKTLSVETFNESLGDAGRDVRAIAVDRFNNKWVGTAGGLVKVDTNDQPEALYTIENSGLFTNTVLSLEYDDDTDILWIGTTAGLNRFEVMGGSITSASRDIHVYPNPFEIWGYDSRATFANLKPGSTVKIYSFNGEPVAEVIADTSDIPASAVWDGRNYEGGEIGSGVYFFTGTDTFGRTFRDKMVVVRR